MANIAHIDIDAFFASVELLRNPDLRGQPVIVAHNGPRAVVTTATYEARAYGIHSGMAKSHAVRLCPQVKTITPNLQSYRQASQQVMAILRSHSSYVQPLGLDEAYIDVSSLLTPVAALKRLVGEVYAETGLTASVGLGPNTLLAKIASGLKKPNGFVELSREEAIERFQDEPPSFIPGIGPKTTQRLAKMGITTIMKLQQTPVEHLLDSFGSNHGRELVNRAHFQGSTKLTFNQPRKSESCERTFDYDISKPDILVAELTDIVKRVTHQLGKHQLQGRTITIKMRTADFKTLSRSHSLKNPTSDYQQVLTIAQALFQQHFPNQPLRLLGVRIDNLSSQQEQPTDIQLTLADVE